MVSRRLDHAAQVDFGGPAGRRKMPGSATGPVSGLLPERTPHPCDGTLLDEPPPAPFDGRFYELVSEDQHGFVQAFIRALLIATRFSAGGLGGGAISTTSTSSRGQIPVA